MNNTFLTILLCSVVLFATQTAATSKIIVPEGGITFSLPEAWDQNSFSPNRGTAKMDTSDPLALEWKRTPITDKEGRPVSAGVNVFLFNISGDTPISVLSTFFIQKKVG